MERKWTDIQGHESEIQMIRKQGMIRREIAEAYLPALDTQAIFLCLIRQMYQKIKRHIREILGLKAQLLYVSSQSIRQLMSTDNGKVSQSHCFSSEKLDSENCLFELFLVW